MQALCTRRTSSDGAKMVTPELGSGRTALPLASSAALTRYQVSCATYVVQRATLRYIYMQGISWQVAQVQQDSSPHWIGFTPACISAWQLG